MLVFNKYYEVDINTQLMTPFIYSDNLIPPNTPFTLRYTLDHMYYLNSISIAGSNVSSLPGAGAVNFTIGKLTSALSNAGCVISLNETKRK